MRTATPLDEELAAANGLIARSDGICSTLATISGIVLALEAPQVAAKHSPILIRGVFTASAGLLGAALLVVLLRVMLPRVGPDLTVFANLQPDQIVEMFDALPEVTVQRRRCSELYTLTNIATMKFRAVRHAVLLAAGGIGVLVLLPAAAVLS
jgi:hypothetical protein